MSKSKIGAHTGVVLSVEALRNQDMTICLERSFEPPHDKTNKMTFAPSKESDQAGHLPSLNSLHCPHEDRLQWYNLTHYTDG